MREVTARELQDVDPNRFQRKYHEWLHYATDHDWWDHIEENFKKTMESFGVDVHRIFFDVGYSQSDHAGFTGRIWLSDWMKSVHVDHEFTYADAYSALFLGADVDGSYIDIGEGRNRMSVSIRATPENSYPSGVFANLEEDAWEELVNDQYTDMDVDLTIRRWVEDKADDLYRDLRDEHDALTSEEAFIESCELNEVTFEVESDDEICT